MTAFLIVGMIFALLTLRQPLLVILLAIAAVVHLKWGQGKLDFIIEDMWVGLDKEVILSIPLFILCGNVMTRGSIAQRLIRILGAITKPLPGGLAVACILSCAVFAAISGSSIVTMLAIGSVMYPAMRQAGYDLKFTLGAIMSGGTLGIIIPPSIPMIIYALVTETSVTDLFAAGFGPGILLTLVLADLLGLVQPAHADRAVQPRRVLGRLQERHLGGAAAGDPARRHLQRLLHGHRGRGGRALLRDPGRDLHPPGAEARTTSTAWCWRPRSSAARCFPCSPWR